MKILCVDDEPDFLETLRRGLLTSGYKNCIFVNEPLKAASLIQNGERFDIALLDITMEGLTGLDLLEIIKSESPATECIMLTAIDDLKTAVSAMRTGAFDYLTKPLQKEELINTLEKALERKKLYTITEIGKNSKSTSIENEDAFKEIITESEKMFRILREAELHATSSVPILITGESGTGKELLANAIHIASHRSKNMMIPVNMASITGTLFDSEFFGHTKGAYTGATSDRKGLLDQASTGTLFLDEIGTLSHDLQGKLLRVLQNGEYIKIGTNTPRKTMTRFIAATNENLEELIKNKLFRNDLYYRLKGGWLHLPPLRERKEDIPLLVHRFFKTITGDDESVPVESTSVMEKLTLYDYPGNIRELQSIIQSALNLSKGKPISEVHLPEEIQKIKKKKVAKSDENQIYVPLELIEKDYILNVYNGLSMNKTRAANVLGVGLNTLRRKLKAYGVS
ncbi:MAG: sigma-54-dependent Fis family transcriptional regulator [Deltaproteobacteria bacterium]|nr:sigma-54-dependent Fis family transcriptional regulator [Deltaproteobacteria bacterium]